MRACLIAIATILSTTSASAQVRYDLLIKGGLVIDGTGAPPIKADVGVRKGRILAVGNLVGATAVTTLDGTGLVVAPGFINLHSHASPAALPTAVNMLTQGVTTELLNADGGGPVSLATQLETIAANGLALNVAASIGFNAVWQEVMGPSNRRPSDDEIRRMQGLVLAGLEEGAHGVSMGLDYKPAYFATTDEVVRILLPAGRWRTFLPNHDRTTPESGFSGRAGLDETRLIGERTGLVPQFTHMKIAGREQGTAAATVEMMVKASAEGRWIASDVYPYLAGQTALVALIIPGWAQDGGMAALRERLKDSTTRARIIAESDEAIAARFNSPDRIMVLGTRRLSDIVRETGATSGGAAVAQILETSSPWAILGFGIESDLVRLMQYHSAAIACDCGAATGNRGHPRYYGTYPRVLGRYVREQRAMTWAEAIRKMSGLPAAMMGLVDRGLLVPGMAADVVVFDSATVIDRATFEQPDLWSEGIRHVVVNGQVTLRDGQATGVRGGVVLRRQGATPSRPFDLNEERRFARRDRVILADSSVATIEVSLVQRAGQPRARGRLTIRAPDRQLVVRAESLGVLQTAGGWVGLTGIARVNGSTDRHPFVFTFDAQDPLVEGQPATVRLEVEGLPLLRGVLGRQ